MIENKYSISKSETYALDYTPNYNMTIKDETNGCTLYVYDENNKRVEFDVNEYDRLCYLEAGKIYHFIVIASNSPFIETFNFTIHRA